MLCNALMCGISENCVDDSKLFQFILYETILLFVHGISSILLAVHRDVENLSRRCPNIALLYSES